LAAKPTRLAKTSHGTFSIRWIVQVHLRERGDARRGVRSLCGPLMQGLHLALKFNRAL
jgi:hypothetical protein